MIQLRNMYWSLHLPLILDPALAQRRLDAVAEFPQNVARFCDATVKVADARVLVDSSKDTREDMERWGLLKTSAYFTVSNIAAESLCRRHVSHYRLLRYEDFVAYPSGACQWIADFMGEELGHKGVLNGQRFEPGARHSAWGNPNRFEHSSSIIRPDDAWRSEQAGWRSVALGLLNAPMARRYGYAIRVASPLRPVHSAFAAATLAPRNKDVCDGSLEA